MKVTDILKRMAGDTGPSARSSIRLDDEPGALVAGRTSSLDLLYRKSDRLVAGLVDRARKLRSKIKPVIKRALMRLPSRGQTPAAELRQAMEGMPLLRAERTYNTSHPDYDASLVSSIGTLLATTPPSGRSPN